MSDLNVVWVAGYGQRIKVVYCDGPRVEDNGFRVKGQLSADTVYRRKWVLWILKMDS